MTVITYKAEGDLWGRFIDHAALGLHKEIQAHQTNLPERIGNSILWTVEELPEIVWKKIKEPRIITVFVTTLALLTNSFLFYPIKTWKTLKVVNQWLPLPPFWALRAGTYLYTSALIVGYGMRAFGRFSNPELMNQFYNNPANQAQQE